MVILEYAVFLKVPRILKVFNIFEAAPEEMFVKTLNQVDGIPNHKNESGGRK